MDKNAKTRENVPTNLHFLIKHKLNNVLNDFEDLCEALDKLGITFKPEFKSSNLNIVSKGGENSDEKTRDKNKSADLLNVSAVTYNSSSISSELVADASGYEVPKFRIEEMKTNSSKISEYNASIFDTYINDFSDCNSEASSTAVNLSFSDSEELTEENSKSYSDESSNSKDFSISESLIYSTESTLPEPYRIELSSVKSHSGGDLMNCLSQTSGSTVKYTCGNTDVSVTADQTLESLKLELISSNNLKKGEGIHTQNVNKALKSPDNDQKSSIDKLCSNVRNYASIDGGINVIEDEFASSHLYPDNDLVATVNAFETNENEKSGTNQNIILNHFASGGVKEAIGFKDLCKNSNRTEGEYPPFDSDSESWFSSLMISDSDTESYSSEKMCSDIKHENVFHTTDLRKEMNNYEYSSDLAEEETIKVANSFYNYYDSDIHWEAQYSSNETKVKKEVPKNFVISDENWNNPTLLAKSVRDPNRTVDDFSSYGNITESINIGFDLYHLNEKLSKNNQESHIEEKSPKTVMLVEVRSILNNILSQPEYSSDLSKKIYQDTKTFSNEPSQNFSLCNSRRSSISSDDSSDSEPDFLENIFKIIIKCHPINASINPEIKFCKTKRKREVFSKMHAENKLMLHGIDENINFSENYCDTDSQGVITFEYNDSLNKNSRVICGALISDYLNTAVKLNILLIKKAKDVSTEDYKQILDTLHYLNDELGLLSAKLIIVINDWMKQFCEIDQNIRGNPQWRMRSPGLYYMGMLRICTAFTKTLFQFCLDKQLELEEYENELIHYHECCN